MWRGLRAPSLTEAKMAVTRKSRSITFTAVNDTVTEILCLVSLALVGTGMTPGQRLTITNTAGDIIADHYVEAANENREFLVEARTVHGLILTAVPAAGTWTVIAGLR